MMVEAELWARAALVGPARGAWVPVMPMYLLPLGYAASSPHGVGMPVTVSGLLDHASGHGPAPAAAADPAALGVTGARSDVLPAALSDFYSACHVSCAVFLKLPGCLTCRTCLACCCACHRACRARREVLACLACRRTACASRLSHSFRTCRHRAGPAGCRACRCAALIALPSYASRLPRLPTHFAAALVSPAAAFVSLSVALVAALVAQTPHESRLPRLPSAALPAAMPASPLPPSLWSCRSA
jgi:hypothetical protein